LDPVKKPLIVVVFGQLLFIVLPSDILVILLIPNFHLKCDYNYSLSTFEQECFCYSLDGMAI
jgi:hypothetical protein